MRICIIAEGSYPFKTGGVSNWLQMLMSWLGEYSFIVYAIGAHERDRGRFNYVPPGNVEAVREVFLDNALKEKGRWGRRLNIRRHEREALKGLLSSRPHDWNEIFSLFGNFSLAALAEFLRSKDLYDILTEVCRDKYSHLPFTDFFWSVRSMIIPLFLVISGGIPEADLYHSVSAGYAGVMGCLGKVLYRKPFVLTEHGIYTREREEEIIKSDWIRGCFKDIWIEHFYCLSRCAYHNADWVTTISGRNKEIQTELGCDESKIEVIPNGIELRNYMDLPPKDTRDDCVNVGAVVRIVPIKDIKTMIQAFSAAKQQYSKIRFYIMGPADEDTGYYDECRQLAESLGLNELVFTGRIDVKEYLGKMDILVLTSISEGQPLAILEGMASGKPFVATNVGSCSELLYGNGDSYGDAGIVVPVMDYKKIGQAIVRLCRDGKLRERMGQNALKRVCALYSKETLIESYKSVYNRFGSLCHGGDRI
jgi:glycosyltransferase involved in cell wall biosynthesis